MKYNTELIKFSNLESRLVFEYSINVDKKGKISSLTFYHKLTNSSCNVNYKNSIYQTVEDFIDLLKGNVYGSLMLEKYKNINDSQTYLMTDGTRYKIGRSIHPNKRVSDLRVASPNIKLLKTTSFVAEKYFHELFYNCNVGGEWFDLKFNDLQTCHILFNASNKIQADMLMRFYHKKVKTNQKVKKEVKGEAYKARVYYDVFTNTKLTFGKFKGTKLKDMVTDEQINYLKWMYRLPELDKILRINLKSYLEFKEII